MAKTPTADLPPTRLPADRRQTLFDDFCKNMVSTLFRIESLFDCPGLRERVLGCDIYSWDRQHTVATERLRANRAWSFLSELYDYAVEGIVKDHGSVADGSSSLVIDAGEIIALLRGEVDRPLLAWHDIVRMGDGRVALEEGVPLDVERIALLANVDVRTVRNAISAGALETIEHADDLRLVPAESARLWLLGRKGFKPTVFADDDEIAVDNVHSADRFGAFLRQRRVVRQQGYAGVAEGAGVLLDAYPGLTEEILVEVEGGVFRVSLNLSQPLADFYGVDRGEFLACVMRVFFPGELEMILKSHAVDGHGAPANSAESAHIGSR